jgi:hypothetical protein
MIRFVQIFTIAPHQLAVFENVIQNGTSGNQDGGGRPLESQLYVITTHLWSDVVQVFNIAPYHLAVFENAIENGTSGNPRWRRPPS